MIFVASPRRTRKGETLDQEDAAQAEMRRAREDFRRRHGR